MTWATASICSTVVRDRHEVRIDRQVVIPQVVAQRLKVPDPFARVRVEGDRAVGEQVLAVAVAAVEVERRRPESSEDEAALDVDAEPAPGVGPAAVLPRVAGPGFVAELARRRHGAEPPDLAPVRTSNARISPGAAIAGPSPQETPTMIVSFQISRRRSGAVA